jgi:predicted transcriptional regulator
MKGIRELTKAEEQVMQVLWNLKKTKVQGIIDKLEPPHPAYNTVSTIVRILEQKGFVGHESKGRAHLYFPLISQDSYRKFALDNLVSGYFSGSLSNLVSFFTQKKALNNEELATIKAIIEEQKSKE